MMWQWLKHAFTVETAPAAPTDAQREQIDLVCREIVRRQLTLPAQMMLESSRPMNFVAGQTLRVVEPFLGAFLDARAIRDFATFMERPGAVEYICQRLDALQSEMHESRSTENPADRRNTTGS